MGRDELILLLLFVIGELIIEGLVIYFYINLPSEECELTGVATLAIATAQVAHLFLVVLNLCIKSKWPSCIELGNRIDKLKMGISIAWLITFAYFVSIACIISQSKDCETDSEFNIALSGVLAEVLASFFFTCCACLPNLESPSHREVSPEIVYRQNDYKKVENPSNSVNPSLN